jgi:6-phosphogluconolactonase (cycloisomerase 2 family)
VVVVGVVASARPPARRSSIPTRNMLLRVRLGGSGFGLLLLLPLFLFPLLLLLLFPCAGRAEVVDGLSNPKMLALSRPDENHLLVVSWDEVAENGTLSSFPRDEFTGILSFGETLASDLLVDPQSITVAPDGSFIFVSSGAIDGFSVLSRNVVNGSLDFILSVDNSTSGVGNDGGGGGIRGLAISPSGEHLYAAYSERDSIALFDWNQVNKTIGFVAEFGTPEGIIPPALVEPHQLIMSPDGATLYATCPASDAVVYFRRNVESGFLTYLYHAAESDGLSGAMALSISPSGDAVYVIGENDSNVAWLSREEAGALLGTLTWQGASALGVLKPTSIASSGDLVFVSGMGLEEPFLAFTRGLVWGKLRPWTTLAPNDTSIPTPFQSSSMVASADGYNVYLVGQGALGGSLISFVVDMDGIVVAQNLEDGDFVRPLPPPKASTIVRDGPPFLETCVSLYSPCSSGASCCLGSKCTSSRCVPSSLEVAKPQKLQDNSAVTVRPRFWDGWLMSPLLLSFASLL